MIVWFDETHMRGNIIDAMCNGIDNADVVLVFVTRNYMNKVERGDDTDNVRREFMFASATPQKMIPIRFDPDLPSLWSGPLRMILGTHLYIDLSIDIGERRIDQLVDAIRHATPRTMWRTAVASTRRLPQASPVNAQRRVRVPTFPPQKTTLRDRVERIRNAVGDTGDGHISDIVRRLAATLLGTIDDRVPMIDRVSRMERELGIP
jgi:hypothetical protein